MVGLTALWMPILLSAVFVFITLCVIHMLPGWHKGDMAALPGEDRIMEVMRSMNVPPGDYRFPFSNSVEEMTSPAFIARMDRGPVGNLSVLPNGEMKMGRMMGRWFVYSLVVAVLVGYVTGRTQAQDAEYLTVFRVSGTVTFCCYSLAHWQNWIWWGKGTRFTFTHTIDGLAYALVTAGTFGWLWPDL